MLIKSLITLVICLEIAVDAFAKVETSEVKDGEGSKFSEHETSIQAKGEEKDGKRSKKSSIEEKTANESQIEAVDENYVEKDDDEVEEGVDEAIAEEGPDVLPENDDNELIDPIAPELEPSHDIVSLPEVPDKSLHIQETLDSAADISSGDKKSIMKSAKETWKKKQRAFVKPKINPVDMPSGTASEFTCTTSELIKSSPIGSYGTIERYKRNVMYSSSFS